jgi:hypothetical protein
MFVQNLADVHAVVTHQIHVNVPTLVPKRSIHHRNSLAKIAQQKRCETLEAKEVTNNISEEQYGLLYDRLMAYRSELANYCFHEKLLTGLDCATGYSLMLLNSILENAKYIGSLQSLKSQFYFYDEEHAIKTWDIMCDVLELPFECDQSSQSTTFSPLHEDCSSQDRSSQSSDSDVSIERSVRLQLESSADDHEDDSCSE